MGALGEEGGRLDGGKTVYIVGASDVIQNLRHQDATPDTAQ